MLGLADRLLPAEAALWDFVAGMQRTKLAGLLVTSGLADALGAGTRDPGDLADELGLSREVTVRVLGAAAACRLVRLDRQGRARLARLGGPLRSDHPRSVASWVAYQAAPANAAAHGELLGQLREGAEPSGHRRVFGNSVWEYFGEHPDEGARFGEAMRQLTAIDLGALSRAYPWPREGTICDVAGGIGTLLAAILQRRPNARGVLVDAPEVLAEAEAFLGSRDVADRVERRAGDLFGELDARGRVRPQVDPPRLERPRLPGHPRSPPGDDAPGVEGGGDRPASRARPPESGQLAGGPPDARRVRGRSRAIPPRGPRPDDRRRPYARTGSSRRSSHARRGIGVVGSGRGATAPPADRYAGRRPCAR